MNSLKIRRRQKELAIIDSSFPRKEPRAFRNAEINEYLKKINNVTAYAMYPMRNDGAWFPHGYGLDKKTFQDNLKGYLSVYPENKGRIKYLHRKCAKNIGLAYSFFLAETYTLLPFYEQNNIPFVFVLYPGGSFGLNYKESDRMLNEVFSSKCFRGVIVTQKLTEDYLLEKNLCDPTKIRHVHGGFSQLKKSDVLPKKYYKKDKDTFDICFVANKYSEKGVDKGYDLFVETAKILSRKSQNIMFHVLGNFGPEDIDISDLNGRIKYYGFLGPDRLPDFYSGMDIMLTPNRPGKLWPGNFDGFPLGADSAYCGVVIFTSDELKMNRYYTDGLDIAIIPLNPKEIADRIIGYYKDIKKFYVVSKNSKIKTQDIWDIDKNIEQRIDFFGTFINLEMKNKKGKS